MKKYVSTKVILVVYGIYETDRHFKRSPHLSLSLFRSRSHAACCVELFGRYGMYDEVKQTLAAVGSSNVSSVCEKVVVIVVNSAFCLKVSVDYLKSGWSNNVRKWIAMNPLDMISYSHVSF